MCEFGEKVGQTPKHPSTLKTQMATIVDSQTSQSLNKQEELHELNLKLDDLFARYLNLLDQYQTARKQLSTELSSVCLVNTKALLSRVLITSRATSPWLKPTFLRALDDDMDRIFTISACRHQGECKWRTECPS